MEVSQDCGRVHCLQPGGKTSDDFPDTFHDEDTIPTIIYNNIHEDCDDNDEDILVTEDTVAHTLVEQLDEGLADVVVVASVHNLHCQHVQSSTNERNRIVQIVLTFIPD